MAVALAALLGASQFQSAAWAQNRSVADTANAGVLDRIPVAEGNDAQDPSALLPAAEPVAPMLASRLLTIANNLQVADPAQKRLAQQLVHAAHSLVNDDPQVLLAVLQTLAGDPMWDDAVDTALTELVTVDPGNQRAQADALIQKAMVHQTVQTRIATVRALLEDDTRVKWSRPVQAEVAARAAVWARDAADEVGLRSLLRIATEADPSNPLAAELQYRHLQTLPDAPKEAVGQAALAWLTASPPNPQARWAFGQALLGQGVYDIAADQYGLTDQMLSGQNMATPVDQVQPWLAAMVGAGRYNGVLDLVNAYAQAQAQAQAQHPDQAGIADDLPLDWLLLRQVAHMGILHKPSGSVTDRQTRAAQAAFDQLMRVFDRLNTQDANLDKAWVAAIFAPTVEEAAGLVQDVTGLLSADARTKPRYVRALGWLALRQKKMGPAQAQLQQIAKTDRMSLLGLALLQPPPRQVPFLKAIGQQDPGGLVGLLAAVHLAERRSELEPTPVGESLLKNWGRVPTQIRQLDMRTGPWIRTDLVLAPDQDNPQPMQPITGTVSVTNDLTADIRMGPAGAVPDWAVLTVSAAADGKPVPPEALPPVSFSLNRWLSVPARQSVTMPISLNHGVLAQLVAENPWATWRVTWTLVTDPRQQQGAEGVRLVSGPMGTTDAERLTIRPGVPLNQATVRAWLERFENGTDAEKAQALVWLVPLVLSNDPSMPPRLQTQFVQAWMLAFEQAEPVTQAWMVWQLPAAKRVPADSPATDALTAIAEMAARSESGLVRLVHLVKHVDPTDTQALNAAKRHEDPGVVAVAEAMAEMAAKAQEAQEAAQAADGEGNGG